MNFSNGKFINILYLFEYVYMLLVQCSKYISIRSSLLIVFFKPSLSSTTDRDVLKLTKMVVLFISPCSYRYFCFMFQSYPVKYIRFKSYNFPVNWMFYQYTVVILILRNEFCIKIILILTTSFSCFLWDSIFCVFHIPFCLLFSFKVIHSLLF